MISSTATAPQATDYLAKLNSQQRRAVEFPGAADGYPPLLIIAGAGSGKTNTLAHRVAHLLVNGADPRRMMLLTFSRRAATEMQKRVGRISSDVMGQIGRTLSGSLSWSGPSTPSAPASCGNMPSKLASIVSSQSTTARIQQTF